MIKKVKNLEVVIINEFYGLVQFIQDTQKNPIPTTNDVVVVRAKPFNSTNPFKLANKSNYNSYSTKKELLEDKLSFLQNNGFSNDFYINLGAFGLPISSCTFTNCEQYLDDVINKTNDSALNLFNENARIYYPIQSQQSFGSESINNSLGTLTITLPSDIFRKPNLLLSVSAKAMGIEISVGKPQVISVNPSTVESVVGSSKPITVEILVKNIGNGSGSFTASLESCNSFIFGSANTITIPAGQQGTVFLSLLPGSQTPIEGQCNGKIYDTSKPSNYTVFSFNGKLKQQQFCEPGSYRVDGLQIKKCKADGSDYYLVETCSYSVKYDAQGIPHCENPALCGNGVIDIGEDCDGSNLNGKTCVSIGYAQGGTLSCGNTCLFDSSKCIGTKDCSLITGSYLDEQGNCVCGPNKEIAIIDSKQVCTEKCEFPFTRITTTQPFWFFWTTTSSSCQLDPMIVILIIALILISIAFMFFFKKRRRK